MKAGEEATWQKKNRDERGEENIQLNQVDKLGHLQLLCLVQQQTYWQRAASDERYILSS